MKEFSRYALAYALWAVSIVVAAAVGLIAQDVFTKILALSAASVTGSDQRTDFYIGLQLRAVQPWTYIIFGILLIILIAFLDHYYRAGAAQKTLLPRFMLVTAYEIGLLTIAHLANMGIVLSLGVVSIASFALPVIELTVTGIFIWLYRRLAAQPILG